MLQNNIKPAWGGGRTESSSSLAQWGNPTPHEGHSEKEKKKSRFLENWNCMCAFNWVFHLKGTAYVAVTFKFV